MKLPFTVDQFLSVFSAYNTAIWPMQVLLVVAALAAVAVSVWPGARFRGVPAWTLALMWLWGGIVYHLIFFRPINSAAGVFGLLFVIQAALFGTLAARGKMTFRFSPSLEGWLGAGLIGYALIVYPVLGYVLGHRYPESPTFGAPCPTTIFTFGLMLWSSRALRWFESAIPVVWAIIGTSAAMMLGMREDLGLPVAALLFLGVPRIVRANAGRFSGLSAAR